VNLTIAKGIDSVEELLKQLSASGDGTYIAVWLDTWAQMLAASGAMTVTLRLSCRRSVGAFGFARL